ncbi:hypothetical protein DESC_460013 [Desulfosarcina cetonica]|nr:hypothetical protein DESC_460013 [Desulfosarcina cetonica]
MQSNGLSLFLCRNGYRCLRNRQFLVTGNRQVRSQFLDDKIKNDPGGDAIGRTGGGQDGAGDAGHALLFVGVGHLHGDEKTGKCLHHQGQGDGQGQYRLEDRYQREKENAGELHDIEGAGAAEDGQHGLLALGVAFGDGHGHGRPKGTGQGDRRGQGTFDDITDAAEDVGAVGVDVDEFIGALSVGALHQGFADDDVTEGDDVGHHGHGKGGDKHIQGGQPDAKDRPGGKDGFEMGNEKSPFVDGGHRHLTGYHADNHAGDDAGNHAVLGRHGDDAAGRFGTAHLFESNREQEKKGHGHAGRNAKGENGKTLATGRGRQKTVFSGDSGDGGAQDDAALDGVGQPVGYLLGDAADAEREKKDADADLQGDEGLQALHTHGVFAQVADGQWNRRGDPAGNERVTEQLVQTVGDFVEKDDGQRDLERHVEHILQKCGGRQAGDKHEQRLDNLRHLDGKMHQRQPQGKNSQLDARLFLPVLAKCRLQMQPHRSSFSIQVHQFRKVKDQRAQANICGNFY